MELSYEGLVAVTPRSGITVIGISPEDAVDNFAVLATLAGKAAEWATSRIDRARSWPSCTVWPTPWSEPDVVSANRRFHRAVNLAAGSPRLLTYLRQAVRVVPVSYFDLFPEQERRSRAEHAALLSAIDGATPPRPAPSPRPTCSTPVPRWVTGCDTNAAPDGAPLTP